MCPVCVTTVALVVAGVTSAGGLAAVAVIKLRAGTGAKLPQQLSPKERPS
jgi:hypothetical protein